MQNYILNPFAHLIEDTVALSDIKLGVVNRLTGNVALISASVRSVLQNLSDGSPISEEQISSAGGDETALRHLVSNGFLLTGDYDVLQTLVGHYVVRPIQNPGLAYQSDQGPMIVVHTSMEHFEFSRQRNQVPSVVEETLPPLAEEIFRLADGTKTLGQIQKRLNERQPVGDAQQDFKQAIAFLTAPHRQLIKLAPPHDNFAEPYRPFNSVPRNLSHAARWQTPTEAERSLADFHQDGIDDASWEFDWIEPTLNHAFRFPSPVFGGMNYGARMCAALFHSANYKPTAGLNVLEIGGGTGSFASSFISYALDSRLIDRNRLSYQILDLSPALVASQQRLLAELPIPVTHHQQNATQLNLPGMVFDLIIANEVIADFQTLPVYRISGEPEGQRFAGEGAAYIQRFDLPVDDAPEAFKVNSGVCDFLELARNHLAPGGRIILTEYGSENKYPKLQHHLNHNEHSIHFGHVMAAAKMLRFDSRLLTLNEFLQLDDEILMLNGSAEQIFCLNHVLRKYGPPAPFAAMSKNEFDERFGKLAERIDLTGVTFSPLKTGFHYGPDPKQFMVVILRKL